MQSYAVSNGRHYEIIKFNIVHIIIVFFCKARASDYINPLLIHALPLWFPLIMNVGVGCGKRRMCHVQVDPTDFFSRMIYIFLAMSQWETIFCYLSESRFQNSIFSLWYVMLFMFLIFLCICHSDTSSLFYIAAIASNIDWNIAKDTLYELSAIHSFQLFLPNSQNSVLPEISQFTSQFKSWVHVLCRRQHVDTGR